MREEIVEEVWKDIPGYEDMYQASNLGRVKSLSRVILNAGKYPVQSKEKFLNLHIDSKGKYLTCYLSKNSKRRFFSIHQIVAMTFLGHVPDGTQKIVVDHINNIKTDNRLENLQLISARENSNKDRFKGTSNHTGVSWSESRKKWVSAIWKGKDIIFLGRFTCEIQASNIYQKALKNLHLYDGCNKTFRELLKNL